MAEFCKQCDEEYDLGNDAKGLITEADVKNGYAMPFLCEGCGPTMVDHLGTCLTDCDKHHQQATQVQFSAETERMASAARMMGDLPIGGYDHGYDDAE